MDAGEVYVCLKNVSWLSVGKVTSRSSFPCIVADSLPCQGEGTYLFRWAELGFPIVGGFFFDFLNSPCPQVRSFVFSFRFFSGPAI